MSSTRNKKRAVVKMSCKCKERLQRIKDLVFGKQKDIEDILKEDGPYWARMEKEGVIGDVIKLLGEDNSFLNCTCEDAKTLLQIEKLIKRWKDSENLAEVQARIQKDEAFYYLEQLLGIVKAKEPPAMKILDPETGEITIL